MKCPVCNIGDLVLFEGHLYDLTGDGDYSQHHPPYRRIVQSLITDGCECGPFHDFSIAPTPASGTRTMRVSNITDDRIPVVAAAPASGKTGKRQKADLTPALVEVQLDRANRQVVDVETADAR